MLQLIDEKLDLKNHDYNSSEHLKYAEEIYQLVLTDEFREYRFWLADKFHLLLLEVKKVTEKEFVSFEKLPAKFPTEFNSVSSLIESYDDFKMLIIHNRISAPVFIKIIILIKVQLLAVISVISKKLVYSKKDVLYFLIRKFTLVSLQLQRNGKLSTTLCLNVLLFSMVKTFSKAEKK